MTCEVFFWIFQLMVLGRLPVPSILNVAGTCQEMRSLSNDPSLWQHLVFRDFGKYQGYDHPLELYHKNSFILELWLKKYCVGDEIQREIITETCNLYL